MAESVATRKRGIHLLAIGVGPSVEEAELRGIATDPDQSNVYVVRDFNALTGIVYPMLAGICNGKSAHQ